MLKTSLHHVSSPRAPHATTNLKEQTLCKMFVSMFSSKMVEKTQEGKGTESQKPPFFGFVEWGWGV